MEGSSEGVWLIGKVVVDNELTRMIIEVQFLLNKGS